MTFGFYYCQNAVIPFAKRLEDEGHKTVVFTPADGGKVADGIIEHVSSVKQLAERSDVVIFDGTDEASVADSLRAAGKKVLGAGKVADKLEHDRAFGEEFARNAGIQIPLTYDFPTISTALVFARKNNSPWYFKTDKTIESDATHSGQGDELIRYLLSFRKRFGDNISCHLQEKIDGTAISTAFWWDGYNIIPPIEGTIEHKKYLDGDLGPSTGCSFNLVWAYEKYPKIAYDLHLENLVNPFRKVQMPPGIYDINSILTPKGPYFLEWCGRMGFDSEPTALQIITDLGELYYGIGAGHLATVPTYTDEPAFGLRLGIPPYPWEHGRKGQIQGTLVGLPGNLWSPFAAYSISKGRYGYELSDDSGILGVAVARGGSLEEMNKRAIEVAKKVDAPGLGYRLDAAAVLDKDVKSVRRLGVKVPV